MKFIETFSNIGRLGAITSYASHDISNVIPTPTYFRYSCAGSIPHLTVDMMANCIETTGQDMLIQPLSTVFEFHGSVKSMGKGLASFVGLKHDQIFHVSVQDPICCTPSGYNTKKAISVWTHGGNTMVTPEIFVEMLRNFRPSSYQAICDSDTPSNCSKKRLDKSVSRTLAFLDECLAEHSKYEELKNTAVFGTIQGGHDLKLRKECALEVLKRPVQGFAIDGLHSNGPDVMKLEFSQIKQILNTVVELLPKDKPRLLNGPFDPRQIVDAVKCGIDLFDSSYVCILTENGIALDLLSESTIPETIEMPVKKLKCFFELNLNDSLYANMHVPLVTGCQCYTCENFTCAYVNHLLNTSELLSKVLLMLHNLYQFEMFFRLLRNSVKSQDFSQLEAKLGMK